MSLPFLEIRGNLLLRRRTLEFEGPLAEVRHTHTHTRDAHQNVNREGSLRVYAT